MKIKNATISEAGNGFPGCGEYVYDSDAGNIYRITTPDCDIRIQTGETLHPLIMARSSAKIKLPITYSLDSRSRGSN